MPQIDDQSKAKSRIIQEIEALRQKIADLELLETVIAQPEAAASRSAAGTEAVTSASRLKSEIEGRLGFFPPYLIPVLDTPEILETVWRQLLVSYLQNPIPEILKEKLFARLARFCVYPYPIVSHSCNLRHLGLSAQAIHRLLDLPATMSEAEVDRALAPLGSEREPILSWPDEGSELEDRIFRCSILAFLKSEEAEHCREELRRVLGSERYSNLALFLSFVRGHFAWIESFPEPVYEADQRIRDHFVHLIREEPHLADLFRNHREERAHERERREADRALRESERRYRELFENANDIVYAHDLQGNFISLNKAAERIMGYKREEALGMNIADVVAPEFLETTKRTIDRQISEETPTTYEVDLVTKEGHSVALEVSARLIYRDGRPVGVQGIARDITERKRTQAALHQANEKLEAWVSELEQRTREMALLTDMGDLLQACRTADEACTVIARFAQQIFPTQAGGVYLISPSRNLVEAVAEWGGTWVGERVFSPDECWALRRGRLHRVDDFRTGLVCKHLHMSSAPAFMCVPMMAQGEALGILHLSQIEKGPQTEARQRLALTVAEHVAMALSNLKLHETLRSQSIRDPLTGLFNRRFMEESLELALRRAARNQSPLGVIMLDLDHFKRFNDTHGHEAGDMLLRGLGSLLQTHIRGEDIACRYGGEEFTLILPDGTLEAIQQRAEYLREAIRNINTQHRERTLGRVCASMGLALFPQHGRTGEALLRAADAALYRAKENGGDQVVLAE